MTLGPGGRRSLRSIGPTIGGSHILTLPLRSSWRSGRVAGQCWPIFSSSTTRLRPHLLAYHQTVRSSPTDEF
jgi:hypothetical protein